jgi:hypothetical protein
MRTRGDKEYQGLTAVFSGIPNDELSADTPDGLHRQWQKSLVEEIDWNLAPANY